VKAKIGLTGAVVALALGIAATAVAADPTLEIERKSRLDGGVVTVLVDYSCDWTSAALSLSVSQQRRGVDGATISTDVICDGATHTLAVEVFGEGEGGQPAPFRHGPGLVSAELVGCGTECGLALPATREIRIAG
jgi:hypothetical protein